MDYLKRLASTAARKLLRAAAFGLMVYMLLCLSVVFLCANSGQVAAKTEPINKNDLQPSPGVLPKTGQPPRMSPPSGMLPKTEPPKKARHPRMLENQAPADADAADSDEPDIDPDDAAPPAPGTRPKSAAAVKSDNSSIEAFALIIDKNLFSPERKKWISELNAGKGAAQMAKKQLNDMVLLGTIISGRGRYAVLRTKKDTTPQNGFQPYTKGDYVQGYLIKEIEEKKVTLLDEAENLMYVIFINDDKKERLAEKTERKPEPPKTAAEPAKPEGTAKRKVSQRPPKNTAGPTEIPDVAKPPVVKRNEQEGRPGRTPPIEIPDNVRQALEEDQEE